MHPANDALTPELWLPLLELPVKFWKAAALLGSR